jgi:hypothetical protein
MALLLIPLAVLPQLLAALSVVLPLLYVFYLNGCLYYFELENLNNSGITTTTPFSYFTRIEAKEKSSEF